MYHPVAIDRNLYAVVSYSVTWYRNLNDVVLYPVNLYRNLNVVVSYPVTIYGIQEIAMSYSATMCYSRDAVMSYPIVSCLTFFQVAQSENQPRPQGAFPWLFPAPKAREKRPGDEVKWKCGQRLSKLGR